VFSGGCDRQAKMWNLGAGAQAQTVAMHDAPIQSLAWISELNLLVTGSWDKTLKCVLSPTYVFRILVLLVAYGLVAISFTSTRQPLACIERCGA
jgi:hypothetical protein